MGIRQLFKPDFYVCEYTHCWDHLSISETGSFPILADDIDSAEARALERLEKLPIGDGSAIIRRPNLIERLLAK